MNGSFVPVPNYEPDKNIRQPCGTWQVWFFMWLIKTGPYRYWITLTSCIRHGGRSGQNKNATGGELFGGVLDRSGILEKHMNVMNRREGASPLVHSYTGLQKLYSCTSQIPTILWITCMPCPGICLMQMALFTK